MTPDRPPAGSDWSEPTLSMPAESMPAESMPAESMSAESMPAESVPVDEPPIQPEPKAEPVFARIPFAPVPVARRRYEAGSVPRWHATLIERAADIALAAMPIPLRVLDVGCGDGKLLAELVVRVPDADALVGLDPDGAALRAAAAKTPDTHISYVRAAAEELPFPDSTFDLIVATASFAHWIDQRAGAGELARVITDNGVIVLVDLLRPSSRQRDRAHSLTRITRVLERAGLSVGRTEIVHRSRLLRPTTRAVIAFR